MTVLHPPETWSTPRLDLRPPRLEDAPAILEGYARDPEVTRFLAWRPHEGLDDTVAFLVRCEAVRREGTAFPWVLVERSAGRVIGMLEARLRGPSMDLGYVLARSAWGMGYMSEALAPLIRWADGQPGLFRVWAVCDIANQRSARVLERAGLEREGILRRWIIHPNLSPDPRDALCYARVRSPAG